MAKSDTISLRRSQDSIWMNGIYNDEDPIIEDRTTQHDATKPAARLKQTTIVINMTAFSLAAFLTSLDAVIVSTALPVIEKDLSLSTTRYSWVGSAYLLAGASLLPLWGPLSDVLGRKWLMVWGMTVFFIGNLIAALAKDANTLIAGRATQGVGGFAYAVLLNIALADMFDLRERGLYYAIYGISAATGAALGPIFSGLLTQHAGWRYCFWIMLPFSAVVTGLTAAFFPASLPERRSGLTQLRYLDWPGAFLITSGTLLLLIGLQLGGISQPWSSTTVVVLLVAGPVLMLVFGVEQHLVPKPIIPLRLFRDSSRVACFIVCFSHGFVYIGAIYYLPVYFTLVLDASPVKTGLWLLITALPCGVFAALVAWSVKKSGRYRLVIIVSAAALTMAIGLFIDFPVYRSWTRIVCYQLILSIGIGSLLQVPLLAIQTSIREDEVTSTNATFIFVRTLSSGISIVAAQVVLQNGIKRRAEMLLASGLPTQLVESLSSHLEAFRLAPGISSDQQMLLKQVLDKSLSEIWILYTAIAGVGFLGSLFIRHQDFPARWTEGDP